MQTWKSCDLIAHIHSAGFSHTISSSFQEVEVTMLGKVIGQHVEQEERQCQNSDHMRCLMWNINPELWPLKRGWFSHFIET